MSEHVVGNGFPTSYYTRHPSPIWPPTQQLKSMQYALFIGYVAKPYHRKRKWDLDDQGQSHTETANKITKTTDEFSSKSSAANDSSSDKSGGDPGKAALGKLGSYNDKGNFLILEYRCCCCKDQRHSCPERYQGNGQRATRKRRWRVCQEYPYQRPQEPLHVDTRSYSSTNPT